ncbi:MAG TPA: DUF421 domain-containing protein [Bacillus sp. (in: firmicutes)]|uniref:DUF421 domain-containing protein n=1 Tax=Bacillus litorisediminis TaxID=2922713 RepID=UPI001FAD54B0|nr:DUF421 domain-containing protein [Bacillus litorisediminis]HWO75119.1 DUF421 domain-containing protein [Bacillus sp. (in: firmicutes)]
MPEHIEIILRALFFVVILFLITKMIGKKQISQLSFFEYVAGITIGSLASEVILKLETNILNGVLAIFVFGGVAWLADYCSLKSRSAREFIEGKSTYLIRNGKILEENLKKEKYSIDDLLSLLREKNVYSLSEVETAILEHDGKLSVFLKKENQPLTAKDLNVKVANVKEPNAVIMDGQILDDGLQRAGKTREWLNIQLEKLDVLPENVFFGQIDSYGELTVDVYDDKKQVPSPQERPLLLAMIKKVQADLELFALETESKEAKDMFNKNALKLDDLKKKLTPYLS